MKVSSREIRISILYFANALMMSLGVFLVTKCNLINWDSKVDHGKIGIVVCATIMMLSVIPLLIISIYHIRKAFKYKKIYYNEEVYIEWKYEKSEWRELVIKNFKINIFNDLKGHLKAMTIVLIITIMALELHNIINLRGTEKIVPYIVICMVVIVVVFLIDVLKEIISLIDHLIFTNCTITITKGMAIANEQVYRFNIQCESELENKQIRDKNIEITYAVPSKTSRKIDNIRALEYKDLKKLIIPIPKNKYEEAEKYIDAPYPIYNYLRDKKERKNKKKRKSSKVSTSKNNHV
ncbi:hypothetical protein BD780_001052 [Clostridium tetanomorphum]|uniref:hypothetical protein n=1 Tax=Clostridium tetanomorphum TaxID=1553 RepID=UPI0004456468|nr:hypothetical protein [Clostridium tetanomorphum]KAJ49111.1 hypothetical protein CTM_24830 [Clostridium tetanomorphum DSM 665]KAJ50241.1 hypothetical protein CTM_19344 [Clostridium tetanomorphum DSM 665]MBP1864381.1 hypothetical protein [Clostridium tetanomorphum]NRS83827.1 hypothetical protein [Clostridium tetanomorphum]SQC02257.1 Uncharacterised protein [Clostridium tetanomorphum]